VGSSIVSKRLQPSPEVERILTRRLLREFGLAKLEAFSEVLVEHDTVIIRKDDWDVCLIKDGPVLSDKGSLEAFFDTHQA
jgi:hypothetical protein